MYYLQSATYSYIAYSVVCIIAALCIICGINTSVAHAQTPESFVPLSPELPLVDDDIWNVDIEKMLNSILMILISAGAVLAVLFFAVSGIQYMATESIPGKGMAKEGMTRVLIGVLLLIISVLILETINPDIVQIDLFDSADRGAEFTER